MKDNCKPDAGVWTDKGRKIQYLKNANDVLSRRGLRKLKDLIVIPDANEKEESRRIDMMNLLEQQLFNIQPVRSRNNSELVPSFTGWSGKVGPDGKIDPKKNDDLAFAFFMTMYWMVAFIRGDVDVSTMSTFAKKSRTEYLNYQRESAVYKLPSALTR